MQKNCKLTFCLLMKFIHEFHLSSIMNEIHHRPIHAYNHFIIVQFSFIMDI